MPRIEGAGIKIHYATSAVNTNLPPSAQSFETNAGGAAGHAREGAGFRDGLVVAKTLYGPRRWERLFVVIDVYQVSYRPRPIAERFF